MEDIDNGLLSSVDGLSKRPPAVLVKQGALAGATPSSKPYVTSIDRGDGNEYILMINGGSLSIVDVNNPNQTQTITASSLAYLGVPVGASARHSFKTVTIMDYTIIVNTTVTTEFETYYYPGTTDASAVHRIYQAFTDLPKNLGSSEDGRVYLIIGDPGSTFDDYYVRWDYASLTYREHYLPNIQRVFKASTMPHKLVKTSTANQWTFEPITWNQRLVGDEVSNPAPSFMSEYTRTNNTVPPSAHLYTDTLSLPRKINDVVFFQDRLVFCSDEYVCFSRAGDYFNFWHKSAATLHPDDPIDISALSAKVSKINSMTPFSRFLLLSSDKTQFVLTSNGPLTASTVSITAASDYDNSSDVKPVALGSSLFLPAQQAGYFRLSEYYLYEGQSGYLADNITETVDTYIPRDIGIIVGNPIAECVACVSDTQDSNVYLYRAQWEGNKKAMAAWTRWVLPNAVLGMASIGSRFYVLTASATTSYLSEIDTAPKGTTVTNATFGYSFDVHMDYREEKAIANGVYNSSTNTTPVAISGKYFGNATDVAKVVACRKSDGRTLEIASVTSDGSGGTIVNLKGDEDNQSVFLGLSYNFLCTLSPIYVRGNEGPKTQAKLKLRNVAVSYGNTGMFSVDVTPLKRNTYTYTYSGVNVGSFITGNFGMTSGSFKVPVVSDGVTATITMRDSSIFPCSFFSVHWEGMYVQRA
jgi:hypothetical protein